MSSLAGEALAMVAAVGEVVYNQAILSQIYGDIVDTLPVIVITDSKNLYERQFTACAWLTMPGSFLTSQ